MTINNIQHSKTVAIYNQYVIMYKYYFEEYAKFKKDIKDICPFTDSIKHNAYAALKFNALVNLKHCSNVLKHLKENIKTFNREYVRTTRQSKTESQCSKTT